MRPREPARLPSPQLREGECGRLLNCAGTTPPAVPYRSSRRHSRGPSSAGVWSSVLRGSRKSTDPPTPAPIGYPRRTGLSQPLAPPTGFELVSPPCEGAAESAGRPVVSMTPSNGPSLLRGRTRSRPHPVATHPFSPTDPLTAEIGCIRSLAGKLQASARRSSAAPTRRGARRPPWSRCDPRRTTGARRCRPRRGSAPRRPTRYRRGARRRSRPSSRTPRP